jgi:SAM-dependent methyltransferase
MTGAATAEIVAQAVRGEVAPGMALIWLLLRYRTVAGVREALQAVAASELAGGVQDLQELLARHAAGSERAAAILAGAEAPLRGIEDCRRLFDWAASVDPEASVALYSLGDPLLLEEATLEVVAFLERAGVVAPGRDVLDIGCGIGRFERALADRVASVTGIDVSGVMIEEARRRCRGLAKVRLLQTSGEDLAAFADASFDAVIAVDSFPYLYQAGGQALAVAMARECGRVLRPGGDLLVLNLAYGEDADARTLAAEAGLVLQGGSTDLATWDGASFHFRKG